MSNDLEWVRSHAPADGSVEVSDVTDDFACIGMWGPGARDVLGQATGDDLSNDAFPYLTARRLTVAGKTGLGAARSVTSANLAGNYTSPTPTPVPCGTL